MQIQINQMGKVIIKSPRGLRLCGCKIYDHGKMETSTMYLTSSQALLLKVEHVIAYFGHKDDNSLVFSKECVSKFACTKVGGLCQAKNDVCSSGKLLLGKKYCSKSKTCGCCVQPPAVCSPSCVHGNCSAPSECTCTTGWTGKLCDTPLDLMLNIYFMIW